MAVSWLYDIFIFGEEPSSDNNNKVIVKFTRPVFKLGLPWRLEEANPPEDNPIVNHIFQEIRVLYRSNELLIVDKPADLKMDHPSKVSLYQRQTEPTLAQVLVRAFPDLFPMKESSTSDAFPLLQEDDCILNRQVYLIHQLDSATSGIVCIALTKRCAAKVSKLFRKRQVLKEYVALLDPCSSTMQWNCDDPIEVYMNDDEGGKRRLCQPTDPGAQLTITRVKREEGSANMVRLVPLTGRKHQLRVLCSQYLNAPIVGDWMYNSNCKKRDRMYLHATRLELKFPSGPLIVESHSHFPKTN